MQVSNNEYLFNFSVLWHWQCQQCLALKVLKSPC